MSQPQSSIVPRPPRAPKIQFGPPHIVAPFPVSVHEQERAREARLWRLACVPLAIGVVCVIIVIVRHL